MTMPGRTTVNTRAAGARGVPERAAGSPPARRARTWLAVSLATAMITSGAVAGATEGTS